MHLDHGRHADGIPKVVGVLAFGQTGAGGRFHGQEARLAPLGQAILQEGEGESGKAAAAAHAADDNIGIIPNGGQGLLGLLADHRLMQKHMVEHRAERIPGVGVGRGHFHRFRNGNAQTALRVGAFSQNGAACIRFRGWAGDDACAPGLHHRTAVRFLLITDLDHVDQTLQAEELAGEGQG